MNEEQRQAHNLAVDGHNLCILGSAGTGKSYVVSEIYKSLRDNGVQVQITCSTGIACSVYPGLNACTVHKFLGLEDGRYDPKHINNVHDNTAHYSYVRDNIKELQCLIVDECSMISRRTFDSILAVCSRNDKLRLIFVGDFYQLPPVANPDYNDSGEFCFLSDNFSVFKHIVILNKIHRTSDEKLISAITDVFNGHLSSDNYDFLVSLKRPLPPATSEVNLKLFSKNEFVDDYNRRSILNFPGTLYEFKSQDTGNSKELKKVTSPDLLWLKINCPVILLKNLSDRLVNGLIGRVTAITESIIMVKFQSVHSETKIERTTFTVFSPSMNRNTAEREQFPLKPAFAVTIHKAQGMSLQSVEIDCRDIFRPGQLGVALSRVKSREGLRVINFHPRYVMAPPAVVTNLMTKDCQPENIPDYHTCCQSLTTQHRTEEGTHKDDAQYTPEPSTSTSDKVDPYVEKRLDGVDVDAGETLSEDEIASDDEFQQMVSVALREEEKDFDLPFTVDQLIQKLWIDQEMTDVQKKMNKIVSKIDKKLLELFVRKLCVKLSECAREISDNDQELAKGVPEKKLNAFYKHVHEYNTNSEFKMNCLLLFECDIFTEEHMLICYNVLEEVRLAVLGKKVDLLKLSGGHISRRYVSTASHARIRYVAGYCLATLRKRYTKTKKSKVFDKTIQGQISYEQGKCKLNILDCLKEQEIYIEQTTKFPESLDEVQKKQRPSCALTHVTDQLYLFFNILTDETVKLLINENLLKYGKELYSFCATTLTENSVLHERFVNLIASKRVEESFMEFDASENIENELDQLVSDMVLQVEEINKVFKDLALLYLSVLLAQFRRDVKSGTKLERKMAHRKQIKVKAKDTKTKEPKSKTKESKIKGKGPKTKENVPKTKSIKKNQLGCRRQLVQLSVLIVRGELNQEHLNPLRQLHKENVMMMRMIMSCVKDVSLKKKMSGFNVALAMDGSIGNVLAYKIIKSGKNLNKKVLIGSVVIVNKSSFDAKLL